MHILDSYQLSLDRTKYGEKEARLYLEGNKYYHELGLQSLININVLLVPDFNRIKIKINRTQCYK